MVRYIVGGVVMALVACSQKEPAHHVDGEGPGETSSEPVSTSKEERVQLERYPRMVMPREVVKSRPTTVFVGLRETPAGPSGAVVIEGSSGEGRGSMQLDLPKLEDGEKAWDIDVILSAPDFTIDGGDARTIQLPESGPSTMARYDLTLTETPASGEADVQAYLFHEGAFMGLVGRTVKASDAESAEPPPITETTATAPSGATSPSHELHLLAIDENKALVVINEPGKTTSHSVVDFDSGSLPGFLGPKFSAIRSRGLARVDRDPVGISMVKGLGTQLWEYTPAPIRTYLLDIYDDEAARSLRVYTNVPSFPWELVRPVESDGTALEPLGTRFRLGRWHLRMGMSGLAVPPTQIDYRELVAMVPEYGGDEALPATQRELAALNRVAGFRRVPGRAASMALVVSDPPNGVLHFAGHGAAQESRGEATRFALRLEDGTFDSTAFVGLDDKRLRDHETLVFFNACELGQADAMANIVEGWAPVMLDAGASGYIGALWPVGDDEAAAFAEAFYDEVERSITRFGRAQVTEILRCLRERGQERQDPTWQAYVFYGDPSTVLQRDGVAPTEPGGAYTCGG